MGYGEIWACVGSGARQVSNDALRIRRDLTLVGCQVTWLPVDFIRSIWRCVSLTLPFVVLSLMKNRRNKSPGSGSVEGKVFTTS